MSSGSDSVNFSCVKALVLPFLLKAAFLGCRSSAAPLVAVAADMQIQIPSAPRAGAAPLVAEAADFPTRVCRLPCLVSLLLLPSPQTVHVTSALGHWLASQVWHAGFVTHRVHGDLMYIQIPAAKEQSLGVQPHLRFTLRYF